MVNPAAILGNLGLRPKDIGNGGETYLYKVLCEVLYFTHQTVSNGRTHKGNVVGH